MDGFMHSIISFHKGTLGIVSFLLISQSHAIIRKSLISEFCLFYFGEQSIDIVNVKFFLLNRGKNTLSINIQM